MLDAGRHVWKAHFTYLLLAAGAVGMLEDALTAKVRLPMAIQMGRCVAAFEEYVKNWDRYVYIICSSPYGSTLEKGPN